MSSAPGEARRTETTQRRRQGPRQKHVPQRMCIACREHDAKRAYTRLVRTPEGRVEVDRTGKANGRGAYLCQRRACWRRAIDSRAIERALKVEIDDETRARLWEFARSYFPPDAPTTPSNATSVEDATDAAPAPTTDGPVEVTQQ